ncbi:unnamed protein product [Rhizopus microsporus]
MSETTRKVFFRQQLNKTIQLFPFSFGYLTVTAKGLNFPLSFITTQPHLQLKNDLKLIAMGEELKPSISTPIIRTTLNQIETSISTPVHSPIRKAPRPSTSARTPSAAPIQIKNSISIPLRHKKTYQEQKRERQHKIDEDEEMIKPVTLAEKRERQAKRAYQIKTWKVREEREAREARSLLRKRMMNGPKKETEVTEHVQQQKKKGVRFNLKKNKIIELTKDEED